MHTVDKFNCYIMVMSHEDSYFKCITLYLGIQEITSSIFYRLLKNINSTGFRNCSLHMCLVAIITFKFLRLSMVLFHTQTNL